MIKIALSLGCLLLFFVPFHACAEIDGYRDTVGKETSGLFRIVLDPGHGGRDSVTQAGGFYEKDLVLSIAKQIKASLEDNGFDVLMTREYDEFISLPQRALIKGDVFISLHANTVADTIGEGIRSMIKGIEIYTSKSMERGPEYLGKSKLLAAAFQRHLAELQGIRMRGTKEKSLAVLNQNQSPAILIELGFLSNKDDLAFLTDSKNYPDIAKAFVKAFKTYQLYLKP